MRVVGTLSQNGNGSTDHPSMPHTIIKNNTPSRHSVKLSKQGQKESHLAGMINRRREHWSATEGFCLPLLTLFADLSLFQDNRSNQVGPRQHGGDVVDGELDVEPLLPSR
jgi:hypothetical protein